MAHDRKQLNVSTNTCPSVEFAFVEVLDKSFGSESVIVAELQNGKVVL